MKLTNNHKKVVAAIFLISTFHLFLGCHNFYKATPGITTSTATKSNEIDSLSQQKKVFILRQGAESYLMKDLSVDNGKMIITSLLDTVPSTHQAYIMPNKRQTYKIQKAGILNEVHIFVPSNVTLDKSKAIQLGMGDIDKIEIIQKDGSRTTSSYILGGLAYTLGALTIISIIILATKSSCPFVSTHDGERYNLQGEIFGGAIYPSLQREDFIPLQVKAVNGDYMVKISNELQERQYTDYANLLIVDHDKDVRVLSDLDGKLFSVANPQSPIAASVNQKTEVLKQVNKMDNKSCLFDDETTNDNINALYLTFDNASHSSSGKLVLNLKNSYWTDYLYGEFTKHFGSYYEKWIKQQKKRPAEDLNKWTNEQNIPLSISVKVGNEWKEIRKIKAIGPLLNRQIVVPVPLGKNEKVEIRLSTGFMFWEVDYAGLDISSDKNFLVQEVKPYEAADGNGVNVMPGLQHDDHKFLSQPKIGNLAIMKYKSPVLKDGMQRTVILHTSGYYEHVRNYTGKPDVTFLKGFAEPGAFQAFSKKKYFELRNAQLNVAKK